MQASSHHHVELAKGVGSIHFEKVREPHTVLCAAGYNLRWLLRAIARLGIAAVFLRLQVLTALLAGRRAFGVVSSTPAAPNWSES